MKNLKKIGAALLAVAMLCSVSVVAFAADDTVDAVVPGSADTESQITINNAVVTAANDILTVTLDYSISGTVEDGDQITMLGYIFETGDKASEVEVVTGNIRAIDQAAAVAQNGQISFKLATAGEGYTVAPDAKMVVKLGSDAASVTKAQAFFIDLALVTETGEIYHKGDINNDGQYDGSDWMTLLNHVVENSISPDLVDGNWQYKAADLNDDGVLDGSDWMELLNHVVENSISSVVGTEFLF